MSLVRWRGRRALALTTWASFFVMASGACSGPAPESLSKRDAPIIGGSLDTTHKGVVSLLKQVEGGFFPSCSGTLLTQNLVLTARHCVARLDSDDGSQVECGSTEFRDTEPASSLVVSVEANVGQEGLNPYRVAKIWVPEGSRAVCGRDIALLLLQGSGVAANVAKPIEPGLTGEVQPEAVFAAIGYGLQDPDDQQGQTLGHRMGVDDAQVFCAGLSCGSDLVFEREWIADAPVCSGDSGGPALDQAGRVVGVTSRGDPECTVGIYTSVFAWRDFIVQGVFDAATAGNYTPPTWAGDPPPDFEPPTGTAGNTSSGGTTGATGGTGSGGTGLNLAGMPAAIAGNGAGGGTMSPVIDPLGLMCNGTCPGAYKCWAETGQPPGICVPACGETAPACPANYTCSTELQACIRSSALASSESSDDGSCAVAAPGHAGAGKPWLAAMALVVLGGALRVRRRR